MICSTKAYDFDYNSGETRTYSECVLNSRDLKKWQIRRSILDACKNSISYGGRAFANALGFAITGTLAAFGINVSISLIAANIHASTTGGHVGLTIAALPCLVWVAGWLYLAIPAGYRTYGWMRTMRARSHSVAHWRFLERLRQALDPTAWRRVNEALRESSKLSVVIDPIVARYAEKEHGLLDLLDEELLQEEECTGIAERLRLIDEQMVAELTHAISEHDAPTQQKARIQQNEESEKAQIEHEQAKIIEAGKRRVVAGRVKMALADTADMVNTATHN